MIYSNSDDDAYNNEKAENSRRLVGVEQPDHNLSALNLDAFPIEILIIILSFVDPLTLENTPLVCRTWYNILKDDLVWNAIFKLRFPFKTNVFSTVTRSKSYKTELLYRTQLRYNFKRGKLLTQQYSINHIITGSSIAIDWQRNKLTVIDIPRETIVTCDIRNGKSLKFSTDFVPEGVTSFDTGTSSGSLLGSRALVFGRWDGSVSGSLIDWKGLLLSDVCNWGSMSGGRITCVTACVNSALSMTTDFKSSLPSISSLSLSSPSSSSTSLLLQRSDHQMHAPKSRSHNILIKAGMIGAFSSDESGNIYGWDIRNGACLFQYKMNTDSKISKLHSDGKTVLIIVLENGEIWVLKNVFDSVKYDNIEIVKQKIGKTPLDSNDSLTVNVYVDYGGEAVVIWNSFELHIISYSSSKIGNKNDPELSDENGSAGPGITNPNNYHNLIIFKPPANQMISIVSFESTDKLFLKREPRLVGTDPLLAAICFNSGTIEIINIRETSSSMEMVPLNLKSIIPKFLNEHENNLITMNFDNNMSPVASVAINSFVLAVSSHLGKVEIFDIMTGEYLRTVVDRISKRKIQELEHILPNRLVNNLIKVYLDNTVTRGVLIIGPHIQYFLCGNSKHESQRDKKFKSNKRFNDKKGDLNEELKYTLDMYELEKSEKDKESKLIKKFNGSDAGLDLDEQLNLAMVMSMSLNDNKSPEELDEMEQLKSALEASLKSSDAIEQSGSEEAEIIDDDLRLAIELSKQENYRQWEDGFEDGEWESII